MAKSKNLWFIYANGRYEPQPLTVKAWGDGDEPQFNDLTLQLSAFLTGEPRRDFAFRLQFWKLNEPLPPTELLPHDAQLENIAERLELNLFVTPFLTERGQPYKTQIVVVSGEPPKVEEEVGEGGDVITAMAKSYLNGLSNTRSGKTPSQAAKSREYRAIQAGEDKLPRLFDCRYAFENPVRTSAPPIRLFNPAFAHFSADATDPAFPVSDETILDTVSLMDKFAAIYRDEKERNTAINTVLGELLGSSIQLIEHSDQTKPDGATKGTSSFHGAAVYTSLNEGKNEVGNGGSDPSTQVAFSFLHNIAQVETKIAQICCCPMFLIAHAGPWLVVLGAVYTDKCIIQRLTDFIWIPVRSCHDEGQYLRIARIFSALQKSLKLLDDWYSATITSVSPYNPDQQPPTLHPRFFPTPISYRDSADQVVKFKYHSPLERDAACVTYLAETSGGKVVVKFVDRYCAEAHMEMEEAGFAPKLLYHGPIDKSQDAPSYGDLQMVVMEFVDGMTVDVGIKEDKLPNSFLLDLTAAIHHLHSKGFVFGDLRRPNVMISKEGKVKLIDFDWAGKEGEVKYPPAISTNLPWANGVKGLGVIKKDHDLEMLHESRWKK